MLPKFKYSIIDECPSAPSPRATTARSSPSCGRSMRRYASIAIIFFYFIMHLLLNIVRNTGNGVLIIHHKHVLTILPEKHEEVLISGS